MESVTVALNGNRTGNAALTLVQKGGLVLRNLTGPEARMLLFDSPGTCMQTETAQMGVPRMGMEAGTYTVVLLQKTSFLPSVPHLSYLDTIGLTEGKDYLLQTVNIEDGQIACLENCAVPPLDENALSYTEADKTGLTNNKPGGVTAGELILFRAFYEMDPSKNAQAESIQVVLPAGIQLTEYSILLDKEAVEYSYEESARTISVNVSGRTGATMYLYGTAVSGGSHSVGAFLTLTNGAVQPIGTTTIQAENASLNVVEKTGIAKGLTASGKTANNATISLYDNDKLVKTTTANASGSWSTTFDLAEPVYNYSYHFIYAKISGGKLLEPITTEQKLVTYNSAWTEQLVKITMYNTGDHGAQETVFDFTGTDMTTPYFRVWPSVYPTFTFKAEFTGDPSALSEVYIVTTNSAGEKTYVEAVYDPETNVWVGTHNYTSFDQVPVQVGTIYDLEENTALPFDREKFSDALAEYTAIHDAVDSAISDDLKTMYDCGEPEISEDGRSVTVDLTVTNPDTQQKETVGSYTVTKEPLEETPEKPVTPETLKKEGYTPIDKDQVWSKTEYQDYSISTTYVDLKDGVHWIETLKSFLGSELSDNLIAWADKFDGMRYFLAFALNFIPQKPGRPLYGLVADITNTIGDCVASMETWKMHLKGNQEALRNEVYFLRSLLESTCMDTGKRLLPDETYEAFQREVDRLEKQIQAYCTEGQTLLKKTVSVDTIVAAATNVALNKIGQSAGNWSVKKLREYAAKKNVFWEKHIDTISTVANVAVGALTGFGGSQLLGFTVNRVDTPLNHSSLPLFLPGQMDNFIRLGYNEILAELSRLRDLILDSCSSQPCKNKNLGPIGRYMASSNRSATYIADPSGYVYEAVPSNRLEGVTATISFLGQDEEDTSVSSTWSAEEYDQVNPQITSADGVYYWDVPAGNWRVDFTKNGYQPADTSSVPQAENGWLPVPPPQLEINVGMVSTSAPVITQAAAYPDRVEIAFRQYMNIASVQEAVSLHGGAASVEPLDAEYNLEGTTQYATRFVLTAEHLPADGTIPVTIDTRAKNYAGTPLAEVYQQELPVKVYPTGISVPDAVSVNLHSESRLTVVLEPGIAGQTLRVETLTPGLVSLAAGSEQVKTDANGNAVITLNGNLPGTGQIRITEPVSGLGKTVAVNIATVREEPTAPAAVSVALANGAAVTGNTTIPIGAKVTLLSTTQGAEIRYTLDDTCPCEENALVYSGPITITKNTVLRAATLKNGLYSTTIRYVLTAVHLPDSVTATIASVDRDFTIVTVTDKYDILSSSTKAFAALYEDGRMIEIEAGVWLAGEDTKVRFERNISAGWTVFFLDPTGYIPLCEKIKLK